MTEIENYLSVRQSLNPHDQNPYLLAGINQAPLKAEQLKYVFRKALKAIGLDQGRKVIGDVDFSQPTPHSLRHPFAVNTLMKIKERGQSPQRALPVLGLGWVSLRIAVTRCGKIRRVSTDFRRFRGVFQCLG